MPSACSSWRDVGDNGTDSGSALLVAPSASRDSGGSPGLLVPLSRETATLWFSLGGRMSPLVWGWDWVTSVSGWDWAASKDLKASELCKNVTLVGLRVIICPARLLKMPAMLGCNKASCLLTALSMELDSPSQSLSHAIMVPGAGARMVGGSQYLLHFSC